MKGSTVHFLFDAVTWIKECYNNGKKHVKHKIYIVHKNGLKKVLDNFTFVCLIVSKFCENCFCYKSAASYIYYKILNR